MVPFLFLTSISKWLFGLDARSMLPLQLLRGQLWLTPWASRGRLSAESQGSQVLAALADEQSCSLTGAAPAAIRGIVLTQKLFLLVEVTSEGPQTTSPSVCFTHRLQQIQFRRENRTLLELWAYFLPVWF